MNIHQKSWKFLIAGIIFFVLGFPVSALAAEATSNLPDRISQLFQVGVGIIAFVAIIGVVIGGFQYLASGGNAEKAGGAKQTILNSIIGLAIAILAVVFLNTFSPQFTKFSSDWFLPTQKEMYAGDWFPGTVDPQAKCHDFGCGWVQNSKGEYRCLSNLCHSDELYLGPGKLARGAQGCVNGSKDPNQLCQGGLTCVQGGRDPFPYVCESKVCGQDTSPCTKNEDCCIYLLPSLKCIGAGQNGKCGTN